MAVFSDGRHRLLPSGNFQSPVRVLSSSTTLKVETPPHVNLEFSYLISPDLALFSPEKTYLLSNDPPVLQPRILTTPGLLSSECVLIYHPIEISSSDSVIKGRENREGSSPYSACRTCADMACDAVKTFTASSHWSCVLSLLFPDPPSLQLLKLGWVFILYLSSWT